MAGSMSKMVARIVSMSSSYFTYFKPKIILNQEQRYRSLFLVHDQTEWVRHINRHQ
jgi:hypothetical protein